MRGTEPSRKSALIFGAATAGAAGLSVLAVLALVLTQHPFRAVLVLGATMCLLGVLRALWPGQPWFAARGRISDGAVYLLVGALLLWLAPWTAAVAPVP